MRGRKRKEHPKRVYSFSIDFRVYEKVLEISRKEGVAPGQIVEKILIQYFRKRGEWKEEK